MDPVVQPQVASTPMPAVEPVKPIKKRSKAPFILIGCFLLLVCVVVVFAGGLFVAYQSNTDIPVFSNVVEKFERVLTSDKQLAKQIAAQEAAELESLKGGNLNAIKDTTRYYKYDFSIRGDVAQSGTTDKTTFGLQGSGAVDNQEKNIKLGMDSTASLSSGALSFAPALNLRLFQTSDNTLAFFKVSGIPTSMLQSFPDINGKWIKLDYKEMADLLGTSFSTIDPTNTSAITIPDEDLDKLKTVIQSDVVINNFKRNDDQVLDGVRTNCFEESFQEAQIADLFAQFQSTSLSGLSGSTTNQGIKSISVSACVGRKDQRVYKMVMNLSMSSPSDANLTFEMNFKDYDVPLTVDQPAADMTLQELLTSIYTKSFSSAPTYNFDY